MTCEKGFARKKTYNDHFLAAKNAKCKKASTRLSAKSKAELENQPEPKQKILANQKLWMENEA